MNQENAVPAPKKYLVLYFVLTIPLSWVFWIPMILINQGVWTLPVPIPMMVWSTLGAVSPLLALGIIERLSRKQVQLKTVFQRIRLKEFRAPWTLASPFIVMGISLLMILTYFGVEAARGADPGPLRIFDPDVFATLNWWILLIIPVHFFASLITSPLLEEPGWRGFAFENLQRYLPRDLASLIVGSYWWLWHQAMNIAFGLVPSLYGYLFMLLDSVAIDALYTLSGGNLFAAMLAHQAMGTAFMFLFPSPALWYVLAIKFVAVAALRYQVHRQSTRL
jgi:membrane protease YdiL (CAAX protease family)